MPTPASPDDALARYLDAWMNGGRITNNDCDGVHEWGAITISFETDIGQRWARICKHCGAVQTRIGQPERVAVGLFGVRMADDDDR